MQTDFFSAQILNFTLRDQSVIIPRLLWIDTIMYCSLLVNTHPCIHTHTLWEPYHIRKEVNFFSTLPSETWKNKNSNRGDPFPRCWWSFFPLYKSHSCSLDESSPTDSLTLIIHPCALRDTCTNQKLNFYDKSITISSHVSKNHKDPVRRSTWALLIFAM